MRLPGHAIRSDCRVFPQRSRRPGHGCGAWSRLRNGTRGGRSGRACRAQRARCRTGRAGRPADRQRRRRGKRGGLRRRRCRSRATRDGRDRLAPRRARRPCQQCRHAQSQADVRAWSRRAAADDRHRLDRRIHARPRGGTPDDSAPTRPHRQHHVDRWTLCARQRRGLHRRQGRSRGADARSRSSSARMASRPTRWLRASSRPKPMPE